MGTVLSRSITDPIMETDPPSVTTQNDFPSDHPTTADPIMETDPPSVTTRNDFPSDQPTTADPIMESDPPSVTTQNDFPYDQSTTADPIMETDLPSVTTQNNTLSNETDTGDPVVPIAVAAGCTTLVIIGIVVMIVILLGWCHQKRIFRVNEDAMMLNSMTGECIDKLQCQLSYMRRNIKINICVGGLRINQFAKNSPAKIKCTSSLPILLRALGLQRGWLPHGNSCIYF